MAVWQGSALFFDPSDPETTTTVTRRRAQPRGHVVLGRIADASIIYAPVGNGDRPSAAVVDRIDEITGEVTRLATLDNGMYYVGPHAVIRNGILAFATDDRIIHAFDLSTNERVMKTHVRADLLLRLVSSDDAILATYIVETPTGPRTRVSRVNPHTGLLSEPELEIEAKARTVSSHLLSQTNASAGALCSDVIAISAEAASSWGPFGVKLAVLWKRGDEPLIVPGANEISVSGEELVLASIHGTRRIAVSGAKLNVVSFLPADHLQGDWLMPPSPTIARRLGHGERPAPTEASPVMASTLLIPKRVIVRRNPRPVGRTILDSLQQLEEQHGFVASSLMMDVFSLALEAPAVQWRLGSLGLVLRDPTYARWLVPGADPSLVVFGELATDVDETSESASCHRLLAFYMYPASHPEQVPVPRTNPTNDNSFSSVQPPIVLVDPGMLKVTWAAKDFDSFFCSFLRQAESRQPTTVDTILELLGSDAAMLDSHGKFDETIYRQPPWFTRVHGPDAKTPTPAALFTAQASLDLLLQERLLVTILSTDTKCNALMIGQELRKVYRELKWQEHENAVRRWATASPR